MALSMEHERKRISGSLILYFSFKNKAWEPEACPQSFSVVLELPLTLGEFHVHRVLLQMFTDTHRNIKAVSDL